MLGLYTFVPKFFRLKQQHIVLLLLVSFAFVVVAVMTVVLAALQTVAATSNALDENRSRQAVMGALTTLQDQMATTVHDYSVWDDAAKAIYSSSGNEWVIENFGLDDEASGIFDTSYLLGWDDRLLLGFQHGKPFSVAPWDFLSPAFDAMLRKVRNTGTGEGAEAVGYVRTAQGIAIIGVSSIRAASADVAVPKDRLQQLVFVQNVDEARIAGIAKAYRIEGLHLIDAASVTSAHAAITDVTGQVIGGLAWTAQVPGDISYHQVRPYVLVAIAIVGTFVVLLVFAGSFVICKLREDEIAARRMALTDRLSGLANRLGFLNSLQDIIAQAQNQPDDIVLFYLDMDGFKEVNDVYGHATGDRLIRSVATGLRHLVPPSAILARLGGDEFAIALPVTRNAADVMSLEAAILDFFSAPFEIDDLIVVAGVSVGTALSLRGSVGAEELLRRADIAMYKAKTDGRGRCIAYDAEMDAVLANRNAMEIALRTGITAGELFVVYQPIVDSRSHDVVGLEALLRWNSQDMGLVSPETFIPLAESCGLIDRLGLFVMEEALRTARVWPQISISINVSPAQFRNPFFVPGVARLLAESGVCPSRVTLEVTEGYFIHNPANASNMIEALNALGLRIALDDFGAGFSSIGYLRQFGFDRLKLDRSMIAALEDVPRGREMLQATLALARALDIPVTAEGIETEEQAIFLMLCGCDQLQGYFFSRPIEEAALPGLLARNAGHQYVALSD